MAAATKPLNFAKILLLQKNQKSQNQTNDDEQKCHEMSENVVEENEEKRKKHKKEKKKEKGNGCYDVKDNVSYENKIEIVIEFLQWVTLR